MVTLVVALLIAWLILSVIGFAVKGLLWLGVLALIAFVITAGIAWVRRNSNVG